MMDLSILVFFQQCLKQQRETLTVETPIITEENQIKTRTTAI